MRYYRQGDIVLIPLDKEPDLSSMQAVRRENGRLILQRGEVTGHAHVILDAGADSYKPGEASMLIEQYLHIGKGGATLTHEEHNPIPLGEGWYEVRRQREYEPQAIRLVRD